MRTVHSWVIRVPAVRRAKLRKRRRQGERRGHVPCFSQLGRTPRLTTTIANSSDLQSPRTTSAEKGPVPLGGPTACCCLAACHLSYPVRPRRGFVSSQQCASSNPPQPSSNLLHCWRHLNNPSLPSPDPRSSWVDPDSVAFIPATISSSCSSSPNAPPATTRRTTLTRLAAAPASARLYHLGGGAAECPTTVSDDTSHTHAAASFHCGR